MKKKQWRKGKVNKGEEEEKIKRSSFIFLSFFCFRKGKEEGKDEWKI